VRQRQALRLFRRDRRREACWTDQRDPTNRRLDRWAPGESGDGLNDLPIVAEEISAALLDTFDRQRQIDAAARLVARHLTLGHSPDALITTLTQALLREDAGFHAYQMLEAGVRQFQEWGNCDQGRHILIAVARYLAAHFPTQRALLQTADIANRLMRGGELHREAEVAG